MKTTKQCLHPGCTDDPTFKVEDGKWICHEHIMQRMHSPRNMALTQAHMDFDDATKDDTTTTH
jgi:hypothetical protein